MRMSPANSSLPQILLNDRVRAAQYMGNTDSESAIAPLGDVTLIENRLSENLKNAATFLKGKPRTSRGISRGDRDFDPLAYPLRPQTQQQNSSQINSLNTTTASSSLLPVVHVQRF